MSAAARRISAHKNITYTPRSSFFFFFCIYAYFCFSFCFYAAVVDKLQLAGIRQNCASLPYILAACSGALTMGVSGRGCRVKATKWTCAYDGATGNGSEMTTLEIVLHSSFLPSAPATALALTAAPTPAPAMPCARRRNRTHSSKRWRHSSHHSRQHERRVQRHCLYQRLECAYFKHIT